MSGRAAVLAFDIGASNGRAMKAVYENGRLSYREVHRFENSPRETGGHFCWDFDALLAQVRTGLEKAGSFDSVAFDTWGVDFGLLGRDGKLLAPPVHYRDARTKDVLGPALKKMGAAELYARTGNQIMAINTLFQLLALKREQPELLRKAKTLLFMPDLFAYSLCGKAACERSIASTSQMLDPRTGRWRSDVLEAFGLPERILLSPVPSGTVTGALPGGAKVIAAAGHDTQCAVAAMPSRVPDAAFLSCGTWSLLGTELDAPVLTEESCAFGLSNELGANGKVDYLKNIIGLWLIQESRREWRRRGQDFPSPTWSVWRGRRGRCAASSTRTRRSLPRRATSRAACGNSAAARGSPCRRRWAKSCAASTRASRLHTAAHWSSCRKRPAGALRCCTSSAGAPKTAC